MDIPVPSASSTALSSPNPNYDGTQGITASSLAILLNSNTFGFQLHFQYQLRNNHHHHHHHPTKRIPATAAPLSLAQYPHGTESTPEKGKHTDDGGAAVAANAKTKPKKRQTGQTKLSTSTSGSGMKHKDTKKDTEGQVEADYQLA